MKFKATTEQIAQVAANAVNAATAAGMGILHYDSAHKFTKEDFLHNIERFGGYLDLDYVEGRMVKLYIHPSSPKGYYECREDDPKPDYQSWCHTYHTYADLLKSAGIVL
jgi:hypothetical protein